MLWRVCENREKKPQISPLRSPDFLSSFIKAPEARQDRNATKNETSSELNSGVAMNWVDGASVDSSRRTGSFDPATGKSIGIYADASPQDVVTRINKMVEDAIAAGAKVLLQGGPISEEPLASGAFYNPTLLEVTDPKMTIMQDEVFGPVLTMMAFDMRASGHTVPERNSSALLIRQA